MSKSHTPGPWVYRKQAASPFGAGVCYGVGPEIKGAVWFVAENVGEEDARLIAAAPALLAALLARERFEAGDDHVGEDELLNQEAAAIALAGGREETA